MSAPESGSSLFGRSLPGALTDAGEPVFAEPWQAQAFAIAITLYERGLFSWPEWAETLADKREHRAACGDDQNGHTYYEDWLAALEELVGRHTAIHSSDLGKLKGRWERAYRTTPHGEKVVLEPTA